MLLLSRARLPAAVALGVLGWTAACGRAPTRVARAAGAAPVIRVMTYNVNFGIPGDGPTLDAIAQGAADVVLLQELNHDWDVALRARFAARYPYIEVHPRGGAGGIGVLSRLPIRASELLRPTDAGWFPALRLVLAAPFGPLQVLVVHLRPPVSDGGSFVSGHFVVPSIHEGEIEGYLAALGPNLPTLVAGDFNEEEDGRAIAALARHGLRSALPEFAPERTTWRWPTAVGTLRRRLDHLVYDGRLDVYSIEVLDAGRSDHLPVVAVLGARRPGP